MGPEEESVDKAEERYLFTLQDRQRAAELAKQTEWERWEQRVLDAREALIKARNRAEAEALLKRAHELLHPKTERVNGL